MRRPPIACRRAVQSLHSPAAQHIWISDEQLSHAVNRFFRNSCPHQKRHGSHVPGPLEARRRASKRRMAISANFHPQDNFPPPFSLGALFGFRKETQPTWRYEAPSPQHSGPPLGLPTQAQRVTLVHPNTLPPSRPDTSTRVLLTSDLPHSVAKDALQTLEPTYAKAPEVDIGATASDAMDPEACFEVFKTRVATASDLEGINRRRRILNAWQLSCPPDATAAGYNVAAIRHIIQLEWDPTPLFEKARLLSFAVPPTYAQETMELLKCAENISTRFPDRLPYLHRLYKKLAEDALQAEASTSASQDDNLLAMMRQLWHSACSPKGKTGRGALALLQALAGKLNDPYTTNVLQSLLRDTTSLAPPISLLAVRASETRPYAATLEILRCIPRTLLIKFVPAVTIDLARAIDTKSKFSKSVYEQRLKIWLRLLHHLDSSSTVNQHNIVLSEAAIEALTEHVFTGHPTFRTRPTTLLQALLFRLSEQDEFYAASSDKLSELINFSRTYSQDQKRSLQPAELVAMAISRMQETALPYHKFANTITALLANGADLGPLLTFLTVLEGNKVPITATLVVDRIVKEKVADLEAQNHVQTDTERQQNASALSTCQKLVGLLSRTAPVSVAKSAVSNEEKLLALQAKRQFQHLMERALEASALPLAYRNIAAGCTIEERTALIQQLAHQYSNDKTLSHRELWRAMYYLYRYLRKYSLHITPLFSRAAVRSSIVRPLSENRFVSSRRLIWVCHLVARVEGEEVAKRIESDFWEWRGDLLKHARSVHVSVGGDRREKTHVNTMKRLGLI